MRHGTFEKTEEKEKEKERKTLCVSEAKEKKNYRKEERKVWESTIIYKRNIEIMHNMAVKMAGKKQDVLCKDGDKARE